MESGDSRNNEMVAQLVSSGFLKSERIIEAFVKTPRHMFIPKEHNEIAYLDMPVLIMKGTTISQPSTVAFMLEMLDPGVGDKVLEIGSGSGYQASLLGHCVGRTGKVVSVEIDPDVANFAKDRINRTKQKNVEIVYADGSEGYEKEAPYDRIIVTAAMPSILSRLRLQLKIGGIMIAPIGNIGTQEMFMIKRTSDDGFKEEKLGYFKFVPLKGSAGFS